MEFRRVEGIDTYHFPPDLIGHPLLAWMGEDYVVYMALRLLERFREQDSGTEMLGIKCEGWPALSTRVSETTGEVVGMVAEVNLQILLRDSRKRPWRLRGLGRFTADNLEQGEGKATSVGFDVKSTEEAT